MDKVPYNIAEDQIPITYYFCTYFDCNYLTRGLALYESLVRQCQRPFILWILCFDDETYASLTRLNLPAVRLISQQEFEAGDEPLLRVKSERSRVEYYWTCTPSLPLYILNHHPEVDIITYLDADLYFFSDPQPIYDEFGGNSILIIEHRYTPELAPLMITSGIYNVGLLSFRPDANGMACLHWWRERCIEWCYNRYEDGKFGDQLYLNDWPYLFRGVAILQHKGAGLSPWNFSQYNLQNWTGNITVDGQSLIFFHYHGFRCVHAHVVDPVGYAYRLTSFALSNIFFPYAQMLSKLSKQLQLPFIDKGYKLPIHEIFSGLFERRMLVISSKQAALKVWTMAFWAKGNPRRITTGFTASQNGNLQLMRRSFIAAIFYNPLQLANIEITSLLVKSIVGEKITARVRAWKHRKTD